ncbi:hypothetical protein FDECE_1247 [Fusarium decemcellulare]|nr:hypothetical protein FDECE_1247 [Fusarium decemcellulare]
MLLPNDHEDAYTVHHLFELAALSTQVATYFEYFPPDDRTTCPDAERIRGIVSLVYGSSPEIFFRSQVYGKRFVVGTIHHGEDHHWTSFIFDRVSAILYHYHPMGRDFKKRLRHAVLAVREMWAASAWQLALDVDTPRAYVSTVGNEEDNSHGRRMKWYRSLPVLVFNGSPPEGARRRWRLGVWPAFELCRV